MLLRHSLEAQDTSSRRSKLTRVPPLIVSRPWQRQPGLESRSDRRVGESQQREGRSAGSPARLPAGFCLLGCPRSVLWTLAPPVSVPPPAEGAAVAVARQGLGPADTPHVRGRVQLARLAEPEPPAHRAPGEHVRYRRSPTAEVRRPPPTTCLRSPRPRSVVAVARGGRASGGGSRGHGAGCSRLACVPSVWMAIRGEGLGPLRCPCFRAFCVRGDGGGRPMVRRVDGQ